MSNKFDIIAGPDRLALVSAMVLGQEAEFTVREINSSTAPMTKMKFTINSIGRESGDGHSWLLKGYHGTIDFEAYYRTHANVPGMKAATNRGFIHLKVPMQLQRGLITSARIEVLEVSDWMSSAGGDSIVHVQVDGGVEERLFVFYGDEITFVPSEFVGLTKAQGCELKVKKDLAYLKSDGRQAVL